MAFESPDGRFVYYLKAPGGRDLWKLSVSGGEEERVIAVLGSWNFSIFSDGIYFIEAVSREPSIRFLSFTTGKVRVVCPIRANGTGLSVSPDRRSLLYAQGDAYGSDLMLVENFRP